MVSGSRMVDDGQVRMPLGERYTSRRSSRALLSKWRVHMATPAAPVQMIKASGRSRRPVKRDDSETLVANISKAMRKVGIRRDAVFVTKASSAKKVYAYSVLPSDTSKIA